MRLRKMLRSILLVVGGGFLLVLLWHSRESLLGYLENINLPIFAASVILGLAVNLVLSLLYHYALNKYNIHIGYCVTCKIYFYSQIAKYIPGKIWVLLYQVTHINSPHAISAVLFANIDLTLTVILMVTGVSTFTLLLNISAGLATFVFITAALLSVFTLTSCLILRLTHKIAVYFNKLKLKHSLCICKSEPGGRHILMLSMITLFGFGYIACYVLMLNSVFEFSLQKSLTYVGYLGLSWIVGALVFLSPGGIGVREAFFVSLANNLDSNISMELLAAIAIFSRCWLIAQELLGAFFIKFFTSLIKLEEEK